MPDNKKNLPSLEPIENIDPAIHAPSRLIILAYLGAVESTDFTFLLTQTGLSRGNLSTHISKLEEAGYVPAQDFVEAGPCARPSFCRGGPMCPPNNIIIT